MWQKGPPIGIDLGTTYIRVAICNGATCRMIPDEHGNSAMPSYVAFTNSGLLVGEAARVQAPQNPANTVFDVIRLIGRHPWVQNDTRLWPFKVIASPNEMLKVEVNWNGRLWQFTAVEICSMLLMQIKENIKKELGTTVTNTVITVPVCFNYAQHLAIKQAGMIAGLDFMQIISAPAANALFYGLERLSKSANLTTNISRSTFKHETEHNIVIFDLGAGTLDVAAVTIKDDECRVRATTGDAYVGGSDFDNRLFDYFVGFLKQKGREDLSSNPMARSNLRTSCETAKISLSSSSCPGKIKITSLYNDVNYEFPITEEKFNDLNNDLFKRCIRIMGICLVDAMISVNAVHEVILAGSSAKIPLVKKYIQSYFKNKVPTINQDLEEATAYGAAFQALMVSGKGKGRAQCLSLLDVATSSLGLRSVGGEMHILVPKNMNIPVKIEKTFRSNIISYPIEVYEGEGKWISQNIFHGKCELTKADISSNSRNITVSFEIHENCTLTFIAEEIPHGKPKITIFTNDKIENSQIRVRGAFHYKESGKDVNKTSTTKSLTRNDTSCCWRFDAKLEFLYIE